MRVVWSTLTFRRPTETFHEFLVDHLKETLGQAWIDRNKRPNEQAHVVMRWIYGWHEHAAAQMPEEHRPGEVFSVAPSGEAMALLSLADDVYRLQLRKHLPRRLLERLRSPDSFQGARYEVAVASIFARCGFTIEWLDEKTPGKKCEFVATHPLLKAGIAVEAKSRHRKGVLNESGPPTMEVLGADVDSLFRKALAKDPGDRPFMIFIDINLPFSPQEGLEKPWIKDMERVVEAGPTADPSPYNLFVVTNHAWHYDGAGLARGGEYLQVLPNQPRHPIDALAAIDAILRQVDAYGSVPPKDE